MEGFNQSEFFADAFPAKTFFVKMLTRDIELPDAILDLLDNCVDGIIRTKWRGGVPISEKKPYQGFYADIEMNSDGFSIKDNCGGIPLQVAQTYAFMMGRSEDATDDKNLPTVGMYGIGMKRALFKMGRNSIVTSHTDREAFEVHIDSEWISNDKLWKIPITLISNTEHKVGTTIEVTELYDSIRDWFSDKSFISNFRKSVAQNFSYIISKGFQIKVNGKIIEPVPLTLLIDEKSGIAPYIYEATFSDVHVLLEIGFSRELPSEEEIEQDLISKQSKDESGITIVCNDRVVLYRDKTMLTGWGEAGVPNFHGQFNGINGIVIFRSNSPEKLPLTTTKRGIEHSSPLYLNVKNQMRIGIKIFTDYTNTWKKFRNEEKEKRQNVVSLSIDHVKAAIPENKWNVVVNKPEQTEKIFKPILPKPIVTSTKVQINFSRDISEVHTLSNFLFKRPDKSASQVGNECFEQMLRGIEE